MNKRSPDRTDRLVTRVCKLDESFYMADVLSKEDKAQASKCLTLAMMTLAAQSTYLTNKDGEIASQPASGLNIFERNIQKSLWQQTNLTLGKAMANPSFKVIHASIIFSVTRRVTDADDGFLPRQNKLAFLHKILERDANSIYLDIALRKLHQYQRKDNVYRGGHARSEDSRHLSSGDRKTYAVVFCLAIMFDSMSAAINCKPFVLGDAETDIVYGNFNNQFTSGPSDALSNSWDDVARLLYPEQSCHPRDFHIWGNHFLSGQSSIGTVRMRKTRWPYPHVDATACISDAVPVKVLFFRRIGHLQTLYHRDATLEEVTVGLAAALDVYDHWNATYGRFLEDCVEHNQDLSHYTQCWSILLTSNFNLGNLILSDLIDQFDEKYMIVLSGSPLEQAIHRSTSMRLQAAYTVSDLARHFCNENATLQLLEWLDVDGRINQAALLREPWITLLVRSFTYTSEILVKLVQSHRDLGLFVDLVSLHEAQSRLNHCISALLLLGQKNDMAFYIAKGLRQLERSG